MGDAGPAAPPSAAARARPIRDDPHPGLLRWVLHLGYDLAWLVVFVVAAPWWVARCAGDARFRTMARQRLGLDLVDLGPPRGTGRVLLHGVSVGEVKACLSLVRALEERHPGLEVVISTTTNTGLDIARRTYPGRTVVRFPLDPTPVVDRFLRRVRPDCVVLMELEIWPNFLRCANRAGVPVAVVNGRITEGSYGRYRWFRRFLPQFDRISLLCVQDDEYAQRFRALAGDSARLRVTGNVKVDGLRVGRAEPTAELARLLEAAPGRLTLVAGSTHEPEERWLAEALAASGLDARLVLVPRHPGRARDAAREVAELGRPPLLLTELRSGAARPDPDRPVVVDTIGELEQVYALADLVYVGGSLVPHGGQNMLEPAAQGIPVVYGPHVQNFLQEAALLEQRGASLRIAGQSELAAALAELGADPERRAAMGRAGLAAVRDQRGATELTLRALEEGCLPTGAPPAAAAAR